MNNEMMKVTILDNGALQLDNCRIRFRNFSGRQTEFNREGDRNFELVIPDMEMAELLQNEKNEYGVGWNIRIKESEDGDPYIGMKVKVKFNDWSPKIFVRSGTARRKLTEENARRAEQGLDVLREEPTAADPEGTIVTFD